MVLVLFYDVLQSTMSALCCASCYGYAVVVKVLLEYGAQVNLPNTVRQFSYN